MTYCCCSRAAPLLPVYHPQPTFCQKLAKNILTVTRHVFIGTVTGMTTGLVYEMGRAVSYAYTHVTNPDSMTPSLPIQAQDPAICQKVYSFGLTSIAKTTLMGTIGGFIYGMHVIARATKPVHTKIE